MDPTIRAAHILGRYGLLGAVLGAALSPVFTRQGGYTPFGVLMYAGLGVLLGVLGVLGVLGTKLVQAHIGRSKHRDGARDTRSAAPTGQEVQAPERSSAVAAGSVSSAPFALPGGDLFGIPTDASADGTPYCVTLVPPELGTTEWQFFDSVGVRMFRSPRDARKWAKLTLATQVHFSKILFMARDSAGDTGGGQVTLGAETGTTMAVVTPMFKFAVTVLKARVRADPDPDEPLIGGVFETVVLQVTCTEVAV